MPKQLDGAPPLASLSARRAWIEISSGVDFAEDWLVALRKESVDRNILAHATSRASPKSLSARRAWIEMIHNNAPPKSILVSLSARRAWIEIFSSFFIAQNQKVALRKESVDRNGLSPLMYPPKYGRSPQGERG